MSRIFKALERAEAEQARPATRELRPPPPLTVAPVALDLPEPRGEYGRLRVTLALAANGSAQRSVMFVSALPGEGVSTLTLGFACAAVETAGRGVLVIDANSARPELAARLGVADRAGLSDLLTKEASRVDAIRRTPVERLFFLGAGRRPIDLSQAHVREMADEVLTDLGATFDYVVVDGGAVQGSSDSLLLAGRVDAVVLVVRAERTGLDVAQEATLALRQAGANLVGSVLTRRREYLPGFLARRL